MSSEPENEIARAVLQEAIEEHLSLMRTAITQARGNAMKATQDYIRALVQTGADRRLEWAVRAEMTGDIGRPRPRTAEEQQRWSEQMRQQARANAMKPSTLPPRRPAALILAELEKKRSK